MIALLFRVGQESDLPVLVHQLGCASLIWVGNMVFSAAAGYAAARYLLGFEVVPSLVIATAMTATSVGVPARVWQAAGRLDSPNGQRFLDVAQLDDLSGVVLMALLFAILPVLRGEADRGVLAVVGELAGTVLPTWPAVAGWYAVVRGVSMIPRAEIAMLIMHRAQGLGAAVAPAPAYGGLVLVSAATCLAAPGLLLYMLRWGRNGTGDPGADGRPAQDGNACGPNEPQDPNEETS